MKKKLFLIGISLFAIIAIGILSIPFATTYKSDGTKSNGTKSNGTKSDGTVQEYLTHNDSLENSPEYKKIINDVMCEVYTTYAQEHIEYLESNLESLTTEEKQKLKTAKELLSSDPEKAAKLFMMLGSCHELWHLQKTILKDKYGIIWYAPSEIYPHIIFD